MEVEAGSVCIFGAFMAEVETGVRLVRRLVLAEPRVPMDAEQRATDRSRIGDEVRADLSQVGSELVDEIERRILDHGVVFVFSSLEPIPIVVFGEGAKECEELGAERRRGGHVRAPSGGRSTVRRPPVAAKWVVRRVDPLTD